MADVLGYVLSEKDMQLLRRVIKTFDRMQHYSNAFGREPEDKLDHEELHTTEMYIARTPSAGIPALMSLGSTGIGDTPGSADCTLFKKGRSTTSTDTLFATLTKTVYNLSEFAIPGDTWVVIVRDKHGSWYAVQAGQPDSGGGGTVTGPGWMAGLSNEDCLLATVRDQVGVCSTIPNQSIILTSPTGVTWTGIDDFVYSGGSGPIVITRPCSESMPKITIAGFCGIFEKAGLIDGACYADFKFGTSLCSDVPGTGSGTGGARGACCSNTFTVRITCTDCPQYYYCVATSGSCIGTGGTIEIQLLTVLQAQHLGSKICSGPYDTYDDAFIACGGCPTLPASLTATITVTGGSCAIANGATCTVNRVPLTSLYDSGGSGFNLPDGNRDIQLSCDNGVWTFGCSGFSTDCAFWHVAGVGVACAAFTASPGLISSSPLHVRVTCQISGSLNCIPCDNPTSIIIDFTE